MPLFGGKKNKIEFDARKELPKEIKDNIAAWEYTHNFKVHYKSSGLQVLASKLDISIPSDTPQLPSHQEVVEAANARLQGSTFAIQKSGTVFSSTLGRFGKKDLTFSYHITHAEYKESIAFRKGQEAW
ncbi:MAG: hypothetical protein QHH18_04420 [Candidatus Bathyarchaeota archaeon]|jgi:hypothetical protein|nr:hypothetical protein [Candidatus Bathyarchaeota archaeon A05DMB-5]MDH7557832.1 hypothetical protein [Candidatus Bathyarchaeota archaeon]